MWFSGYWRYSPSRGCISDPPPRLALNAVLLWWVGHTSVTALCLPSSSFDSEMDA